MKKAIIIMIIAAIITIIILSSLVAYAKGDSNDNKIEDKVTQELMYLNQYFVLNYLNHFHHFFRK